MLFTDRDKELELQQTCLTEKDRLLQQLQQKVTEQSEGINELLESILIIQIIDMTDIKHDTKTISSIIDTLLYVSMILLMILLLLHHVFFYYV